MSTTSVKTKRYFSLLTEEINTINLIMRRMTVTRPMLRLQFQSNRILLGSFVWVCRNSKCSNSKKQRNFHSKIAMKLLIVLIAISMAQFISATVNISSRMSSKDDSPKNTTVIVRHKRYLDFLHKSRMFVSFLNELLKLNLLKLIVSFFSFVQISKKMFYRQIKY